MDPMPSYENLPVSEDLGTTMTPMAYSPCPQPQSYFNTNLPMMVPLYNDPQQQQQQIAKLVTTVSSLQTALAQMQNDLEDTQDQLEDVHADLRDTQDDLEDTRADLKDTKARLRKSESTADGLRSTTKSLRHRLEDLESGHKHQSEDLSRIESKKLKPLYGRINEMEVTVDELFHICKNF